MPGLRDHFADAIRRAHNIYLEIASHANLVRRSQCVRSEIVAILVLAQDAAAELYRHTDEWAGRSDAIL
jgi:hypothetical protein